MADFQKTVALYPGIGVPGAFASINPIVSAPMGYIAGANVPIGGFCWEDPDNEGQVLPSGSGMPLGFVCREQVYPHFGADAIDYVPKGENVSVQLEGDFYVKTAGAVTKGQKVFANLTTGALSGASAGATVSGSVETNWYFVTSAGAGGTSKISNHGQKVVPASAIDLSSYETSAHAAETYSTIANTVTAVVAGSSAHTIKVTKNGEDTTVEIPQE